MKNTKHPVTGETTVEQAKELLEGINCKSCGSTNVIKSLMREDGENIPINKCDEPNCSWWG